MAVGDGRQIAGVLVAPVWGSLRALPLLEPAAQLPGKEPRGDEGRP